MLPWLTSSSADLLAEIRDTSLAKLARGDRQAQMRTAAQRHDVQAYYGANPPRWRPASPLAPGGCWPSTSARRTTACSRSSPASEARCR